MAELAVELGDDTIREMAEKFGFNRASSTPLAVDAVQLPARTRRRADRATGFGQGQVTATPLQMAMVAAGIANGGVVMNPHMVDAVIGEDLSVSSVREQEFGRAMASRTWPTRSRPPWSPASQRGAARVQE